MTQIPIPQFGSKIGFSNNIGPGNFVILSNAAVANPSGEQVSIVSTSSNDSQSEIGIQKVRLRYFDTNWILNDEIITMNGTNQVLSAAINILSIESFEAFQVGTGPIGAAGTITVRNIDETSIYAQIDSTNNTFTRAVHFVSPGKRGYISDVTLNCTTSGGIIFQIFIYVDNTSQGGNIVMIPDTTYLLTNQAAQISFPNPIMCDASQSSQGLMMGITAKGLATNQIGMASFHFFETL
jgi:hypothetical protein